MNVSIVGLDRASVLAALFNAARPVGLGVLHFKPEHVMDRDEAESLLQRSESFDYVEGRVLKVHLKKEATEFNPWAYDRDNGDGAAEKAVSVLRQSRDQ